MTPITAHSVCLGIHLTPYSVKCTVAGQANAVAPLSSDQAHDPLAWWAALVEALGALSRDGIDLGTVERLSITGPANGAVFLDKEGTVLAPAVITGDTDGARWCDWLETTARRSRSINGNVAEPDMMGVALIHLRERAPELFARVAHVLSPRDYLVYCLTGKTNTDPSTASASLLNDTIGNVWADRLIEPLNLPLALLPDIIPSGAEVGPVAEAAAASTGLPMVPVMSGACDIAATCLGFDLVEAGTSVLVLGDQTSLIRIGETFLPDTFRHINMRRSAQNTPQITDGNTLFFHLAQLGPCAGFDTWASTLRGETNETGETSETWFLPKLSRGGVLAGLSPQTSSQDIARAVLHGVAFEVTQHLAILDELAPDDGPLHCVATASPGRNWGPYLASATGRTVLFHEDDGFAAARGAAALARGGGTAARASSPEKFEPEAVLTAHFESIRPRLAALKSRLTA